VQSQGLVSALPAGTRRKEDGGGGRRRWTGGRRAARIRDPFKIFDLDVFKSTPQSDRD
jgi:hypothetical protein